MTAVLSLLNNPLHTSLFVNLWVWFGWFLLVGLLILGLRHWWEPIQPEDRRRWWLWLILYALVPVTGLFLGFQPTGNFLSSSDYPISPVIPTLVLFSALPWVLAAGFFSIFPAVILGILSGIVGTIWITHSPFTPLETVGLALFFSVFVRQRYRTLFYKFLRHPLIAGLVLIVTFFPIHFFCTLLMTGGSFLQSLDFTSSQAGWILLTRGGELFIASLAAEIVYIIKPNWWGRQDPLKPSPSEASLRNKFLYSTLPLIIILVIALLIGNWAIAKKTSEEQVHRQLTLMTQIAMEDIPHFLETGKSLIKAQSEVELLSLSSEKRNEIFNQSFRSIQFFSAFILKDANENLVATYPVSFPINLTKEENESIRYALKTVPIVPIQSIVVPMDESNAGGRISFIASISNSNKQVKGVIIGITEIVHNPFVKPLITLFNSKDNSGIQAAIFDNKQQVVYRTSEFYLAIDEMPPFDIQKPCFDAVSLHSERQIVCSQEISGPDWEVYVTSKAAQAQELAVRIAVPLLTLIILFSIVGFAAIQFGLGRITHALGFLSEEATLISQGRLDHPMEVKGEDEIAQLSYAFENMRKKLKDRLDELNHLVIVSQGVAANLEIEESIRPVLEAALESGACDARAVLVAEVMLDPLENQPVVFRAGKNLEIYSYLDSQLFELSRLQGVVLIPNTSRGRRVTFLPTVSKPGAIIALPLIQENHYLGTLWVGYEQPKNFTEEEIWFLNTLANEASMAASNARLYSAAEVGRQRLEAVLNSTVEPVLVFDEKMRLSLINPAALQVIGLITSPKYGKHSNEVISHPELRDFIQTSVTDKVLIREISFPNQKTYSASLSAVVVDQHVVGKVCILWDITEFKEMNAIKSEFVSTVSHDLRSPLILMSGYTTMIQMVGDLNEQQKVYIGKIADSVARMNRLVTNLLDLRRMEAGIALNIEMVSLGKVIKTVMETYQPQAIQKNIVLNQQGPSQEVMIEADAELLEQVLLNLVENAIKYTPMGGKVEICLTEEVDNILLEVRDTGAGIAPIDLQHIFEVFYRSRQREVYPQRGTGLGLAIVKSIAERHGGKARVSSRLGKGSSFFIELPKKQKSITKQK